MGALEVQRVAGIKFNNYKNEEQQLMLFLKESKKEECKKEESKKVPSGISVVYGANGSGKTTISREISNCVSNVSSCSARFIDEEGKVINDEIGKLDNVFIFNEDFINNNILIKDDGLDTIVLIGEDVNLSVKIEENEKNLQIYSSEIEKIDGTLTELDAKKKKIQKKISDILKNDDGWAQRESKILRRVRKASVTDEIVKSMIQESISEKRMLTTAEKYNSFFSELARYCKLSDGQIIGKYLSHIVDPYPITELAKIFDEVQQKVPSDGTKIERRLSEQKLSLNELQILQEKITESNKYCPSCFQDFEGDYHANLLAVISGLMSEIQNSEKAKEISSFVRTISLNQLDFCKDVLSEEKYEQMVELHSKLVDLNKKINNLIIEKSGAPFEKVAFNVGETWLELIDIINNSYDDINLKISDWDSGIKEKEKICGNLQKLNRALALSEISSEAIEFNEISIEYKTQKEDLERFKNLVSRLESENNQIKSQMAQTKHAADLINDFLRQIFSSNRLILKVDSQTKEYVAYSRGLKVAPKTLSTGERNILALCYFFVACAKNHAFSESLAKPKMIILDDPVSSFDFEHKYGVMMFVYNRFHELLEASGSTSKLLVLTHDLSVAYELDKMFIGLAALTPRVSLALARGVVAEKDFSKFDFYQTYLEEAYNYVFGNGSSNLSYPRNNIRRLFEAYVTFVLKQDVSNWINSPIVREQLGKNNGEVNLFKYFESRPIRAYIHQDSHSKEQMIRGNWMILYSLTDDELKRLIEDVLLLMYFLTPTHVLARFSGNKSRNKEVLKNFNELANRVR
jgi:VE01